MVVKVATMCPSDVKVVGKTDVKGTSVETTEPPGVLSAAAAAATGAREIVANARELEDTEDPCITMLLPCAPPATITDFTPEPAP
jgi:hypothetical protein